MKILLFLIFIPIISFSQNEKLTGIGQIKIGRSFSEVLSGINIKESDLFNPNLKKVQWMDVYLRRKDYLLEFDENKTPKDLWTMYNRCKAAKTVLLSQYLVAGITINKIDLQFYHDTLVSITITDPSTEFQEAIKAKYGPGKLETKTKVVTCTSIYGESKFEDKTFSTEWDTENGIKAIDYLSDYRNSKCERSFLSYFKIYDEAAYEAYMLCQSESINEHIENERKKKKDKLNDF